MIKTIGLKKYYGSARGIEDLDLDVARGEIFGFIGPNGAGKSTTIRTLLGFIKPTAGEATLFGEKIGDAALAKLKQNIGYLPSEVSYYDSMKVGALLTYSASYYKKDCKAKIAELCSYFELDPKRIIEDLSYGNRKKVAIVQAFMHEPELLILDEPTGGLDPLMQNRFFDLVRREHERGATIFFSSHILPEVQKVCDRVGIIKDGRMVSTQNVEKLRATKYKKVSLRMKEGLAFESSSDDIKNLSVKGRDASFIYSGSLHGLQKLICADGIEDFSVAEPDLEEIFMNYYIGGQAQ
jgi:ABC-2 type transport system ATP-binding protein